MLYFWKYKELAQDLRANKIPESTYKLYIACFAMLLIFLFSSSLASFGSLIRQKQSMPTDVHGYSIMSLVISFALSVGLPIIVSYISNRRGDGKYFLRRFICLFLPVGVRTISLIYGMTFAIFPVLLFPEFSNMSMKTSFGLMFYTVFLVGAFCLIYPLIALNKGFKIASGRDV
jgi:hypothetical protein